MEWHGYLAEFHQNPPGITKAALARAAHHGSNPYQWLLAALPPRGRIL